MKPELEYKYLGSQLKTRITKAKNRRMVAKRNRNRKELSAIDAHIKDLEELSSKGWYLNAQAEDEIERARRL